MEIMPRRKRSESPLARVPERFSDLFERFFENWELSPFLTAERTWWPAIDVAERDDAIVVKAEMPGMKREDINIEVHGNTLTISGEKKEETEQKGASYYHSERRYGSFQRNIPLPSDVDPEKIEATHREGVLTVTVPKSEKSKARHIPIKE